MHRPQSSLSDPRAIVSDLNRAKVLFQMRAIAAAIGCPNIVRDVDGDGLMLTVEPLQFFAVPNSEVGGRPVVSLPCGSSPATLPVPACTRDSASRGARPSHASAGADDSLSHGA